MTEPGLVLQHDDDAPPALLADWLDERRIESRLVDVEREGVPALERAPWVVVLGSHHSAAAAEPAWIPAEIERLRVALAAGVPTLGICFGSQALAVALGGRIEPALPLEASWDERIEILDGELIPPGPWLNFHFERFTLPDGAVLLARSRAGPAAFRLGTALGVQFHPEVTAEIADAWAADEHPDHPELDPEAIAAGGRRHAAGAARRAFELFDRWWRTSGANRGRAGAAVGGEHTAARP